MSYAAEVLADNPVAYYRMQEASGLIQDSSGNDNHATTSTGVAIYGQVGPIVSDPSDLSINFDNDPTYFGIPDDPTLDLGDVFTLEAWIKRNNTTGSGVRVILAKGSLGYQLGIRLSTQSLALAKDDIANIAQATTNALNDTDWHHVVATKDGATMFLYIDGADATDSTANQTIENTAFPLTIGANPDGATLAPADMLMDEVALYATDLSPARVLAHYEAALGPAEVPGPERYITR